MTQSPAISQQRASAYNVWFNISILLLIYVELKPFRVSQFYLLIGWFI